MIYVSRHSATRSRADAFWLWTALLLAAAIVLRFALLAHHPATDFDEQNYDPLGENVAEHGDVMAKTPYGQSPEKYLYNPPFYFWLLGAWFRLFGVGIPEARVLAAGASVLTLFLLAVLLRRLIGGRWACVAVLLLAFDGWMIFTNRVGWIENTGFVFAVLGLWLYERAIRAPTLLRFAMAGLMLAWATVFKHQFGYFVVAVAICWLVIRKHHRGHLVLLLTTVLGGVLYVTAMLLWDGRDFRREMTGQLLRLLGKKASSGTVNTPGQVITAFENQYAIYFGMVVALAIAVCVVIYRMVQIGWRLVTVWRGAADLSDPSDRSPWRQRWDYAFARVSSNALLFSWAAAAVICFGATGKVKLPHYVFLVIVPTYCYLAAELRGYVRHTDWDQQRVRRLAAAALVAIVVGSGLFATYQRMVLDDRDALRSTATWIDQNVPPGSLILTEEPIGNNTPDGVSYCKTLRAAQCEAKVDFFVEYTTLTFKPPPSPALDRIRDRAKLLREFKDFKARVRIYQVQH